MWYEEHGISGIIFDPRDNLGCSLITPPELIIKAWYGEQLLMIMIPCRILFSINEILDSEKDC